MTDLAPDACESFFSSLKAHYADVRARLRNPPVSKRATTPIPEAVVRSAPEEKIAAPVEEQLVEQPIAPRLSCRFVFEHVAAFYGVPVIEIASHRREARIAWARHIGMYLARKLTLRSLPEIGRMVGGRDHTTILHGCRRIAALVEGDPVLAAEIEVIVSRITAGLPVAVTAGVNTDPPETMKRFENHMLFGLQVFWNDQRKAELRRLWMAGVSSDEIGARFGRTRRAINERAALLGLPSRRANGWNTRQ